MAAKKKPNTLQEEMKESAHRIWLAGLGALAMAEEEGGKLFKNLVEKGEQFEGKSKDQVAKARGAVADVKTRAGSYLEGFEARIDERMTAVIHRLGVPTKDEIEKLTKKVEQLTKSVDKLRAKDAPSARPRAHTTDSTPDD